MSPNRVANEIAHGKHLAAGVPEDLWGWGTPAGRVRARRRTALILEHARVGPASRLAWVANRVLANLPLLDRLCLVRPSLRGRCPSLARARRRLELLPRFYDALVRGRGEFVNGTRMVGAIGGETTS